MVEIATRTRKSKIVLLLALANFQVRKSKGMQLVYHLIVIADLDVYGHNFDPRRHLGNLAAEHFRRQVKRRLGETGQRIGEARFQEDRMKISCPVRDLPQSVRRT